MFLKLEGQRCLVVGAGDVAEAKIAGLLEAAAKVRVVAPEATPQVQSWAAAGQIEWLARPCEPSDLNEVFLVVAAKIGRASCRERVEISVVVGVWRKK